MYHLELRQFPHNFNHFNVDDQGLRAVLEPWVRNEPIELGERKWSPHQAKLKILEGPRLPLDELSMGRGWRAAEREGEDVTERVLDEARRAIASAPGAPAPDVPPRAPETPPAERVARPVEPPADSLSDPLSLGVQLASLLGDDPAGLLAAWRAVAARASGLSPSETLALAERQLDGSSRAADGGR
jgi:hypothetical protein